MLWKGIFVPFILIICTSLVTAGENELREASQLFKNDRLDQAKQKVEAILDDEPSNAQAHLLLSSIYLRENRVKQALQILEENQRQLKNYPLYYNNLAYSYFYTGKDNLAIDTLQKGLQLDPSYNTLYQNLSTIYAFMARKAYDKALDESDKIQQKLPKLQIITEIMPTASETPRVKIVSQKADLNKERQDIQNTLLSWAKDWSSQSPENYLSYYSNRFMTPAGVSLRSWQLYRRDRVKAPRFIEVKLSNFDIVLADDGTLASVHFLQHYRSNTLNDKVLKQMVLRKEDQKWMILSENVAN